MPLEPLDGRHFLILGASEGIGYAVASNASYRGPAFTGDVTIMTGEIIDKLVDEQGRSIVQVDVKMKSQLGTTLATAKAEIELPKKRV